MPQIATIDEAACIGCTKCLAVCPTDAIVGADKQMHVILQEHCIGCGWCLPPCPTNCISLIETTTPLTTLHIKERVQARKGRLQRLHQEKQASDALAIANLTSTLAQILEKQRG